jgi:1-phosphofructokinase family hexose kinase
VILTLTPNPTVDRAIFLRNFCLDSVVRAEREVVTPNGKGVNASIAVRELGGQTLAMGLNAGLTGNLFLHLLDGLRVEHEFLLAQGETRTLVVLVDMAVNQQSSISAPTLCATSEDLQHLIGLLERRAGRAWGLVCGGSLPLGLPLDSYTHLLNCARRLGLTTLLDTSGEPLRQGVAGLPHILKINHYELAILDPNTPDDATDLSESLVVRLGTWASDALIVTLGERGALAVTTNGCYSAQPPMVPVVNTAGAGDAMSGGIMLARSRGYDWAAALAMGTAAAASVVMNEGTGICRREQVEALLPQVKIV